MNRSMSRLSFLVVFFLNAFAFSEESRATIALNDLMPQGTLEPGVAVLISDRLRTELFNTGAFTVLERGQMETILKEQGFQQSGACSSDACAVEVGQVLGVKYILTGSIGRVGSTYTMNVRMIDVATGRIERSTNSDTRGEVDNVLLHSTVDIAHKLSADFGSASAAPSAKPVFGSLAVVSSPSGAGVTLDGNLRGTTPFRADSLLPGKLPLLVELAGYEPVSEKLKIVAGQTLEKGYVLVPIPSAGPGAGTTIPKSTIRNIRILLAGGTLLCIAAGVFYDSQAKKKITAADDAKDAYNTGRSNAVYETYAKAYNDNINQAKTNLLYRNITYGLGAAGLLSFAFSWRF